MRLPLEEIMVDPSIQVRVHLDAATVERYEEMLAVSEPPPVVVFDDVNLLADGFHRYEARRRAGRTDIEVERRPGGRDEAEAYAITANVRHGLPLTRTERNEGIRRLLDLGWKPERVAAEMGVNRVTVVNIYSERRVRAALPTDIRDSEAITATHLYRVATLPEEQRESMARVIVEEGLSEPRTREVIAEIKQRPGPVDQSGIHRIVQDTIKKLEDEDAWSSLRRYKVAVHDLQRFTPDDVLLALPYEERSGWLSDLHDILAFLHAVRKGLEETTIRRVR